MSSLFTKLPTNPPGSVKEYAFWRSITDIFRRALSRYPDAPVDSDSAGRLGDVYIPPEGAGPNAYLYWHDGSKWYRVQGGQF